MDPIALAQQMWNHSGSMRAAFAKQARPWVNLTSQDLADITAYVQDLRGIPVLTEVVFEVPTLTGGKRWFDSNCRSCHQGTLSLDRRLSNKTSLEIAAGMWNHLPRMLTVPIPTSDDMRKIISYVWEVQYLGPVGNVAAGQSAFSRKNCAKCHNDANSGASTLTRGEKVMTPFSMISLSWTHGRVMRADMEKRGIRWPYLSTEDISNLVAYMNTRP
jgi:mono/diheme cytochrome c family protein